MSSGCKRNARYRALERIISEFNLQKVERSKHDMCILSTSVLRAESFFSVDCLVFHGRCSVVIGWVDVGEIERPGGFQTDK